MVSAESITVGTLQLLGTSETSLPAVLISLPQVHVVYAIVLLNAHALKKDNCIFSVVTIFCAYLTCLVQ